MSLADYLLDFWDIEPVVTDRDARVHIAICTAQPGVVEDFPIRFPEGFEFPEPITKTLKRFYEQHGATFTKDPHGLFDLWDARWSDGTAYKVSVTYFTRDRLLLATITDNTEFERKMKSNEE